ncbi:DUF3558 family protein [Actinomycetospora lutea]|uniref:DUF3558 family protein n=1 Tax=Actinomycetospora lutea TaxID=663604 RepID=UPI002366A97B|nr:DUF3558 family protein [Actinomycetospora lutea]MDD7939278.1 DUF3558 family protein [Actinomycetospora lutea]
MSRLLGLAALAVALVAACGIPAAPAPSPTADRFGAPLVAAPRDVRQKSDPCLALTAADLADIGMTANGRPKTLQTGDRACDWRSADGARYLTIIVIADRDVLVDTYRTRQFAVFTPIQVAGLPATSEQSYPDSTTCTVTVGTAIGQGFVSDSTASDPRSACEQAERAGQLLVAALPPLPGE